MTILSAIMTALYIVGGLLLVTLLASWAMATGLLREGTLLRRAASRLLGWVDKLAALFFALVFGAAVMATRRPKRAPIREQVREQAATRAKARDVRADVAVKTRASQAHAEGVVVDIRVEADNRVEAIRREVAAMDDDELRAAYERAHGRGE